MNSVLRLESFRSGVAAPPEPSFDAADLDRARAEGFAAGRTAAQDLAAAALEAAVRDLAAALADDRARRTAMARAWAEELRAIAGGVAATLAGPLRANALAGRVADALAAELEAGGALPPSIRCEARSAPALSALLASCGANGIAVEAGGEGAAFTTGTGILRIEPARIEAALNEIIAEIGASDEGTNP